MGYLIYLTIVCGYIFSRGFFSFPSALILLFTTIFFLFWLIFPKKLSVSLSLNPQALLVILSALSLAMYGGLYQKDITLIYFSFGLLGINFFLSFFATNKRIFLAMVMIALLTRVFMVVSSPNPKIDVYDFLRQGAIAAVSGQNPYTLTYQKMYADMTPDFYFYLPGTIYLTIPSVIIFNDPRYTFVFAEIAVALIVYKLVKKQRDKLIFPLLLLNNPMPLFIIEQSWTEPLILLGLTVFGWLILQKRTLLAAIVFGIVMATKQHLFLLLPLAIRNIRLAVIACLVAAVLILPYLLWSPADFIHDTIGLQLGFAPRYDGLTFFSLLRRFGFGYHLWLMAVTIIPLAGYVYFSRQINLSRFFILGAFLFLVIFYFNKWSYLNYYYLISQMFLIGIILESHRSKENGR